MNKLTTQTVYTECPCDKDVDIYIVEKYIEAPHLHAESASQISLLLEKKENMLLISKADMLNLIDEAISFGQHWTTDKITFPEYIKSLFK